MKIRQRSVAAVVLAVVLALPAVGVSADQRRNDRGDNVNPIVRVIKKIQKIFSVGTNNDVPIPPIPGASKP